MWSPTDWLPLAKNGATISQRTTAERELMHTLTWFNNWRVKTVENGQCNVHTHACTITFTCMDHWRHAMTMYIHVCIQIYMYMYCTCIYVHACTCMVVLVWSATYIHVYQLCTTSLYTATTTSGWWLIITSLKGEYLTYRMDCYGCWNNCRKFTNHNTCVLGECLTLLVSGSNPPCHVGCVAFILRTL